MKSRGRSFPKRVYVIIFPKKVIDTLLYANSLLLSYTNRRNRIGSYFCEKHTALIFFHRNGMFKNINCHIYLLRLLKIFKNSPFTKHEKIFMTSDLIVNKNSRYFLIVKKHCKIIFLRFTHVYKTGFSASSIIPNHLRLKHMDVIITDAKKMLLQEALNNFRKPFCFR